LHTGWRAANETEDKPYPEIEQDKNRNKQ
jgi:hypothetical protein